MKRISLLALISLIMISCKEERYEGYVVYKSHIPKHMCCSSPETMATDRPIPPNEHTHVEIESKFILHVGNKNGTTLEDVTKDCYDSFEVLDKVRVAGENIELIKKGCR